MAGLSAAVTVNFSPIELHANFSELHLKAFPSPFLCKSSLFSLRIHSGVYKPITSKAAVKNLSSENDVSLGELEEDKQLDVNHKRKLYVVNLPPFVSGPFITKIFRQCGVVQEVEMIKEKDGRSRGYAFVTMASSAQAQAVIDKFNNKTVAGRTVRVQYAKQFKKPTPPRNVNVPPESETRYRLYVSNLAFKARANHLREFFASVSNPVSARVVFDGPLGRSIGYGFVAFATKEEADAALTALNGQELMGRPICIQLSEKNAEGQSGDNVKEEEDSTSQQPTAKEASDAETDISNFLLDRNILLTDVSD